MSKRKRQERNRRAAAGRAIDALDARLTAAERTIAIYGQMIGDLVSMLELVATAQREARGLANSAVASAAPSPSDPHNRIKGFWDERT